MKSASPRVPAKPKTRVPSEPPATAGRSLAEASCEGGSKKSPPAPKSSPAVSKPNPPKPARHTSQVTGHSVRLRRTGRPTKLTRPLITRICTHVRAGNFLETAALACGVTRQTLYNWLRTANTALARTQSPDTDADAEAPEEEYEEQEDREPTEAEADPNYHGPPDSRQNSALVTCHTSHLVSPKPRATADVTPSESLCIEFLDAMEQATAEADIADMAIIAAAAETDWRAAAWRTARRDRRKEYDSTHGAERLCFVPGSLVAEPTPAPPPRPFRPVTPPPPSPTPAELAAQEQREAKRSAVFAEWKKAQDASRAAAGCPPLPEDGPDAEIPRLYEAESFRAWWKKRQREFEALSLSAAAAKARLDSEQEQAAAREEMRPSSLPALSSHLPPPIPPLPSPIKPRSTFVMA